MARTPGADRGRTLRSSAHASVARATREQLCSIANYEWSPHFSDDERVVLRFADLLTATPANVPQDIYDALVRRFGEEGIVELASAIARENYRARFNRAFDVESEGFCSIEQGD